jgi:hypothetical protein
MMVSRNYESLEADIRTLKNDLSDVLPINSKDFVEELLGAGEYGVAFEAITLSLMEDGTSVSPLIFQRIERLAKQMTIPDDNWKPITVQK